MALIRVYGIEQSSSHHAACFRCLPARAACPTPGSRQLEPLHGDRSWTQCPFCQRRTGDRMVGGIVGTSGRCRAQRRRCGGTPAGLGGARSGAAAADAALHVGLSPLNNLCGAVQLAAFAGRLRSHSLGSSAPHGHAGADDGRSHDRRGGRGRCDQHAHGLALYAWPAARCQSACRLPPHGRRCGCFGGRCCGGDRHCAHRLDVGRPGCWHVGCDRDHRRHLGPLSGEY